MNNQYQVLARRYRPQQFSDVVGHEAVLQTLKNGLKRDTVAHAYLFSGSRGVGKTTLARLFAKTLNCSHLSPDFEPCNQCPSCLDVTSAQALDVIEIDGASNRGIDDIRQINETVGFAPSYGKYKITIIDEVHMLTKEAFNALLKTLEEPPERAKFFFATTEPHKVPATILSRCQRFDLGKLLPTQIFTKLQKIADDLKRPTSLEALHLIAQAAEGSLRDAESLFDQVLCFAGESVTEGDARKVLGLAPEELFFAFDRAFAEARFSYAFELVQELFRAGIEFHHFIGQLIEHFRHLLVTKTLSPAHLQMPPLLAERYTTSSGLYTQQQCFAALDLCIKTETTFAKTLAPRTALELLLLQILRTKNRIPIEALVRRLSELEGAVLQAGGQSESKAQELPAPLVAPSPVRPAEPVALVAPPAPPIVAAPSRPVEPPLEPEVLHITPPVAPIVALQARPVEPAVEHRVPLAEIAPVIAEITKVSTPPAILPSAPALVSHLAKHPSHYETVIRFAAVELEGTIIKS